jgi:hypothetical protein
MDRTDRVNFRTPGDWHAVDWDDAQSLVVRLRRQGKSGIAEHIEESMARRRPFVPTEDEREDLGHVIRAWIIEAEQEPRIFGGEMQSFWKDLHEEFPEI